MRDQFNNFSFKEKTLEVVNVNEKAVFSDEFAPQILKFAPNYKTPLICMKPGQQIPPHPSGTGIFFIVSGKAVMTVEGQEVDVKAGDMIFIDSGESRGIRAVENLTAFAVHIN